MPLYSYASFRNGTYPVANIERQTSIRQNQQQNIYEEEPNQNQNQSLNQFHQNHVNYVTTFQPTMTTSGVVPTATNATNATNATGYQQRNIGPYFHPQQYYGSGYHIIHSHPQIISNSSNNYSNLKNNNNNNNNNNNTTTNAVLAPVISSSSVTSATQNNNNNNNNNNNSNNNNYNLPISNITLSPYSSPLTLGNISSIRAAMPPPPLPTSSVTTPLFQTVKTNIKLTYAKNDEKFDEDDRELTSTTTITTNLFVLVSRLLLVESGVLFEEEEEESPADQELLNNDKSLLLFGVQMLPMLEIDGITIVKPQAIQRYLARKFGFYGAVTSGIQTMNIIYDTAKIDMIVEAVSETMQILVQHQSHHDIDDNGLQIQQHNMEKSLKYLNNFLCHNNGGNGFFVGSSLTIADISVFAMLFKILNTSSSSFFPNQKIQSILESSPQLKHHFERIGNRPRIAKWKRDHLIH